MIWVAKHKLIFLDKFYPDRVQYNLGFEFAPSTGMCVCEKESLIHIYSQLYMLWFNINKF